MNARDELAKLLFITDNHSPDAEQDWLHLKPYGPKYLRGYYDEADAVFAAGYSKPRTITTAEELDALPDGAGVIDADHDVSTKHNGMWHGYEMNPLDSRKFAKCGPFTVIHEGDAA